MRALYLVRWNYCCTVSILLKFHCISFLWSFTNELLIFITGIREPCWRVWNTSPFTNELIWSCQIVSLNVRKLLLLIYNCVLMSYKVGLFVDGRCNVKWYCLLSSCMLKELFELVFTEEVKRYKLARVHFRCMCQKQIWHKDDDVLRVRLSVDLKMTSSH